MMSKKSQSKGRRKYERVLVSTVKGRRNGKHRGLVAGILEDLETIPLNEAIKIPLAATGLTIANLRSAVHRASIARKLAVETSSDKENFYIWKRSQGSVSGKPDRPEHS